MYINGSSFLFSFEIFYIYNAISFTLIETAFPMIYYISFVDLFYIPSFLRGEGGSRMAVLEPWRSVGRPRGSQGEGMNALVPIGESHRFEEQHVNHMNLTITS